MWTEQQLRLLIKERKDAKESYYKLYGDGRRIYWEGVASKINLQYGTIYTGRHVREKFQGLAREHRVCRIFYIL